MDKTLKKSNPNFCSQLGAYSKLSLYQKKDMLELLLGNDVIIWSPDAKQVDLAEELFDIDQTCLNGNAIQITLKRTMGIK